MNDQARQRMSKTDCSECGSKEFELDPQTYQQTCANCGNVIEQQMLLTHTSTKGGSGDLEKVGKTVNMRSKTGHHGKMDDSPLLAIMTNNIYKKEAKFRKRLELIIERLKEDNDRFPQAIDKAVSIWKICFEKKLTRGYEGEQLAAILFYMACRKLEPPLPYLLLDFSLVLEINVYKLAKKFHKLCQDIPIDMQSNTDLTTYIPRFVNMMEFGDKEDLITNTACKFAHQMKNDWITTGRRPSGVCGACIFMAAKIHGFHRSVDQIISYVNLSKTTIKKRVNEFLDTQAAKMSVNEFKQLENIQSLPNNMNESTEKPPIIKQQEAKEIKLKKKEEFMKKTQKEIEKYDKEFDEKHNVNRNNSRYSFKGEDDNDDNDDNDDDNDIDFDGIMKSEPNNKQSQKRKTVFVAATDTDDALINDKREEMKESTINDRNELNEMTQEMDDRMDQPNINDGYFSHVSVMRIDGRNSSFTNNVNGNSQPIKDDKDEIMKYFEENDLSVYDDDPAVKSMILSKEQAAAKEKLFAVLNPDW
eukprot:CAMPEP_0201570520 /NCGR_PEP_ID=MMETSP0190_2-20130828/12817_1 /ASSEMBLY_ACC=CAM_ASM_000263 /TAXON_ID=37353 /ORGANISM="Rosalina sp." /LENGTH=529 /DNA_ID=CAMNT_0047994141 /DNA_START=105 /DNA_END=1691 /DNA_ORIENTATION=-